MDLHDVIKKATLLPSTSNTEFYRLKGLSQAEKDRKINEKIVKTPKNLKLLEDDIDDNIEKNDINKIRPSFDRNAIKAAIKEVNGGLDLSNKYWEKFWARHVENMMMEYDDNMKKSYESFLYESTEANSGDQPKVKNSKHQLIRKNKIFRNAAIMGLINTNKISLEDLVDSNNKNCMKEENKLKTLVKDTQIDDECQIEFIPLREDPEVLIHPLRMGIDEKKFEHIDFTVARVGKKIKETPREYFLRTTNDNSFEFVNKNKSTV